MRGEIAAKDRKRRREEKRDKGPEALRRRWRQLGIGCRQGTKALRNRPRIALRPNRASQCYAGQEATAGQVSRRAGFRLAAAKLCDARLTRFIEKMGDPPSGVADRNVPPPLSCWSTAPSCCSRHQAKRCLTITTQVSIAWIVRKYENEIGLCFKDKGRRKIRRNEKIFMGW